MITVQCSTTQLITSVYLQFFKSKLKHLKNTDNIIQGDETPRTRTILQKSSNHGTKDLPIEYDDESMSQSISHRTISSVDDITVDKASPSPSTHMDFFEDL